MLGFVFWIAVKRVLIIIVYSVDICAENSDFFLQTGFCKKHKGNCKKYEPCISKYMARILK